MNDQLKIKWLLLIHQIPPKPDYFRVKIWRRLQKIGAVAIKQSVYVLPNTEQAYEDLHWIVKEIEAGGGTATLSETVFLEGVSDMEIQSLFHTARDGDYEKLVTDTKVFIEDLQPLSDPESSVVLKIKKEMSRLQHRFIEITAIDFFNAPGREAAERILTECNSLLREGKSDPLVKAQAVEDVQGRRWVTRKGINIDRIASAWLILRFIDQAGEIKFVADERYSPESGELRFDMFEGEFTHKGDNCSFEVLVTDFGLASEAITAIAEIVHNIDLKDKKYNRPEVHGIQAVFSGMVTTCSDDQERLERGSMILDELYASFEGR